MMLYNTGSKTANITIDVLCNIMTTNIEESTPYERYAKVNDVMLSVLGGNCTDIKYSSSVDRMQQASWNSSSSSSGEKGWTYQTCN